MRILVTWASKLGGTADIALMIAETFESLGHDVVAEPVGDIRTVDHFDAAVIGGAIYANRWPAPLRRFVRHNTAELRRIPTWFFSSGPLDSSADTHELRAPTQVAILAERIGARGHVTFGGRLEEGVGGMAGKMAKKHAGDWRNAERIRGWAADVARELPTATPGTAIDHPGGAWPRFIGYGLAGGMLAAAALAGLLGITGPTAARVLHAIVVMALFTLLAWSYFAARGAREPATTAATWTAIAAVLHVVLFRDIAVVALLLAFAIVWGVGAVMSMMPFPTSERRTPSDLAGTRPSS